MLNDWWRLFKMKVLLWKEDWALTLAKVRYFQFENKIEDYLLVCEILFCAESAKHFFPPEGKETGHERLRRCVAI